MRIAVLMAWCLVLLLHGAPCFAAGTARPSFKHTVAVAFGGELRLGTAIRVSESMARIGAMQRAALLLEKNPAFQVAKQGYERIDPDILRDGQALAWAICKPIVTGQEQIGKARDLGVRTTVTVVTPPQLEVRIKEALLNPARLTLFRKALDMDQGLLRQFVHVSASLPAQGAQPSALHEDLTPQFTHIVNGLHALTLLRDMLDDYDQGMWKNPSGVVEAAARALELAPDNPLLWYARGTAEFQLQHMQESLDALDRVLREIPDFALALHDRGTTYVRLHLTNLALEDYNAAISLQPGNADFFRSRGSAHLVLEDFNAMCRDFQTACSLGTCENYHWAVSRGHCTAVPTVPAQ